MSKLKAFADNKENMIERLRINSSPNDKILDWSKLKAFADDKMNMIEKLRINSLPNDKILDWSKLKAFADVKIKVFNPLPNMPILGFSNSGQNKDMMSKIWGYNYLIE